MSQANELLDSLSEEEISSYIADPEMEEHIVIDSNRRITVPESLKRIAVQFDHNIETVTFDCPRYWDGIDLSTMKLYVNYMRADGKVGSYHTDNITIDESDETIMHFDWVIDGFATQVKGSLSFLVCVKNVNEYGEEENHWNSELNRDLTISEGLECEESVVNSYPAIITQLLVRMDRVDALATEEAMLKYVADYFAEVDSVVFVGGDSGTTTDIVAEFGIDNEMSDTSDNPVQNKVVKAYVDESVSDKATVNYVNNELEKYTTTEEADASLRELLEGYLTMAKLAAHPVGSYYWSDEAAHPSELFGGEWEQIKGKFVLAAGDGFSPGQTGGEEYHKLTVEEMPSHSHDIVSGDKYVLAASSPVDRTAVASGTGVGNVLTSADAVIRATQETYASGNSKAHNNMPPYITAYCWKRIA
jgi:hypothetical protein